MIMGIQYQKRCGLGDAVWRTGSRESIADYEQSLCDFGFDIGALLADLKVLRGTHAGSSMPTTSSNSNIKDLIQRMMEVDQALENWWDQLVAWAPEPLYWEEQERLIDRDPTEPLNSSTSVSNQAGFEFHDLRLAHLCMDYWAVYLTMSVVLSRTLARIPLAVKSLPSMQPFVMLAARHDETYRISLANSILRSIPFTRRPEMGYIGAQKTIFATRVALLGVREAPGPYPAILAKEGTAKLIAVSTDLGMRFAEDIERNCGEWK